MNERFNMTVVNDAYRGLFILEHDESNQNNVNRISKGRIVINPLNHVNDGQHVLLNRVLLQRCKER